MPAKATVLRNLAKLRGSLLGERFDSIRDMHDPGDPAAPPLVRNYDVTDALDPILNDEKEPEASANIGSIKKTFRDGNLHSLHHELKKI
jgi:type I restriction enzyme, S subunit